MSIEDNKALVQRFFNEVVSQGDEEAVSELLSARCRYFDAGRVRTTSMRGFIDYLVEARQPFESISVDVDSIIAEGDRVAVRCSYHLTHKGEASSVPVMAEFRIEDRKIGEMWRFVAGGS
jgi:predicted SnoaL-like aldol condensation-catalyzing enzyme